MQKREKVTLVKYPMHIRKDERSQVVNNVAIDKPFEINVENPEKLLEDKKKRDKQRKKNTKTLVFNIILTFLLLAGSIALIVYLFDTFSFAKILRAEMPFYDGSKFFVSKWLVISLCIMLVAAMLSAYFILLQFILSIISKVAYKRDEIVSSIHRNTAVLSLITFDILLIFFASSIFAILNKYNYYATFNCTYNIAIETIPMLTSGILLVLFREIMINSLKVKKSI